MNGNAACTTTTHGISGISCILLSSVAAIVVPVELSTGVHDGDEK